MRVGIDIRHVNNGFGTGGARVLENLLKANHECGKSLEFIPYNRFSRDFWRENKLGRISAPILADAAFKNLVLPAWSRINKIDAFLHALPPMSFSCKRVPQISYILDVPKAIESDTLSSRIYNNIYIKQTCLRADMILTISSDAALDIQRIYEIPESRIEVLYLCVDYDFIRECPPYSPDNLDSGSYVLGILSRIAWRKNPKAYIETFKRFSKKRRKNNPLVLVGAISSLDELNEFVDPSIIDEVKHDVICMGRVSDDELVGLIKNAGVLFFPSNFEGFGLPVLEAAACGVPQVTSDIAVFRELFSEVSHQFPPDDYDSMAECLIALLDNSAGARQSKTIREDWLEKFSFRAYSNNLSRIMRKVCP